MVQRPDQKRLVKGDKCKEGESTLKDRLPPFTQLVARGRKKQARVRTLFSYTSSHFCVILAGVEVEVAF